MNYMHCCLHLHQDDLRKQSMFPLSYHISKELYAAVPPVGGSRTKTEMAGGRGGGQRNIDRQA